VVNTLLKKKCRQGISLIINENTKAQLPKEIPESNTIGNNYITKYKKAAVSTAAIKVLLG